jgi:TRAP-type mannitol/chloroaromatic compound transport system permease small subunit
VTGALRRLAGLADAASRAAGVVAAWLYPLLVAVLLANVVLRYGFDRGSIELEELQWHLFAAAFLLGLADTYAADEHVRVDLLHARLSPRGRAWVELLGCLLLLLPFVAIVGPWAFEFALDAWRTGERSSMPSGLPARWMVKGTLFLGLALLGLQGLGRAARSAAFLRGGREG